MSKEYAEKRIREAIEKSGGNAVRAKQQVIAWTYEDSKLLHALTKAHLGGIVAYNIERIMSGRSAASEQPASAVTPKSQQTQQEENFGKELLRAVAGNSGATFGLEGYSSNSSKRPKVSQSHLDAIQAMTKGKK